MSLTFSITHRSGDARVGRIETPHGGFDTPAFMPVGTRGAVKGLTVDQVRDTGAQIVLNNAYHLMLRPGPELVHQLGGVHRFMGWGGPILTDSGGYQAFSMADINSIDDDGVTFRSIIDGSSIHLTPERSIEVQNLLGADIIMAFDDCPPAADGSGEVEGRQATSRHERRLLEANDRTARWLERCVRSHRHPDRQSLFGIIQGGTDPQLRRRSVDQICGVELPGYAIGGVAVGEDARLIDEVVRHTAPLLPADKPRYLMGVGYEWDIVGAVRAGVDMFDCVLPTRNGRNAHAFTRGGRINLRNSRFRVDPGVLEPGCDCYSCRGGFGRAYLRHLFLAREMLGPILTSIHNIRHFQRLMLDIREAIREDSWSLLAEAWPVLAEASSAALYPGRRGGPSSEESLNSMFNNDVTFPLLFVAQENEPFSIGGDAPASGTTQQPGAAGGAKPGGDPLGPQFFLIVLVVLGGMIAFSMLAQRRDRKKREAMLTTLKKHDKVQTIGGIVGSIVDVKKDAVVLKVDESSNTRITFSRSAIQQVLGGQEAGPAAAVAEKS